MLLSGLGSGFVLVEQMFCRMRSRWPLLVAGEWGMCLAMLDRVMAGQVRKLLFLMALSQVEATGEKQAACKKAT